MTYELTIINDAQYEHFEGTSGPTIEAIIEVVTNSIPYSSAKIIKSEYNEVVGVTHVETNTHSFTFVEVEAKTEFTRSQIEAITHMIIKLAGWRGIDLTELDEQFNGAYGILEEALNND